MVSFSPMLRRIQSAISLPLVQFRIHRRAYTGVHANVSVKNAEISGTGEVGSHLSCLSIFIICRFTQWPMCREPISSLSRPWILDSQQMLCHTNLFVIKCLHTMICLLGPHNTTKMILVSLIFVKKLTVGIPRIDRWFYWNSFWPTQADVEDSVTPSYLSSKIYTRLFVIQDRITQLKWSQCLFISDERIVILQRIELWLFLNSFWLTQVEASATAYLA